MINCTCIKDNLAALKKQFGTDTNLTNTRNMINFKTGKTWTELEPLRFRYHPKNINGTISKKWVTSFVNNNFCALCGKRKSSKKRKD
jgi:hypothetical protein